jgi:hypothetical protein
VVQRFGAINDLLRAKEKAPPEAVPPTGEPLGSKPDPSAGRV